MRSPRDLCAGFREVQGMRVLMFGWEFAPSSSGGLGTACCGLTKELVDAGMDILFVMPGEPIDVKTDGLRIVDGSGSPGSCGGKDGERGIMRMKPVGVLLGPYMTDGSYRTDKGSAEGAAQRIAAAERYGEDIYREVSRYAERARSIAREGEFDIVHVHDWMAVPAGIAAKEMRGVPLVVHVHSLESDRTPLRIDERVYGIERFGMNAADHIIAVSSYTKKKIVEQYDIAPEKISVVYHAVFTMERGKESRRSDNRKQVLFLGRLTTQKGPGYFLEMARHIVEMDPEIRFVIAGDGDLTPHLKEKTVSLNLENHVRFTGFLDGPEVARIYAASDLYVMPSLSEPFGITALEAVMCDVPVILSRQSGVTEILKRAPAIDYWETDAWATESLAILYNDDMRNRIIRNCREDMAVLSRRRAADDVVAIYRRLAV